MGAGTVQGVQTKIKTLSSLEGQRRRGGGQWWGGNTCGRGYMGPATVLALEKSLYVVGRGMNLKRSRSGRDGMVLPLQLLGERGHE